jgi:hypothetical protein
MEAFGSPKRRQKSAFYYRLPSPAPSASPPLYDEHLLNEDGEECGGGVEVEIVIGTRLPTVACSSALQDEQITKKATRRFIQYRRHGVDGMRTVNIVTSDARTTF